MKLLSLVEVEHPQYEAVFDSEEFMLKKSYRLTYTANEQLTAIQSSHEFWATLAELTTFEEKSIINDLFLQLALCRACKVSE